MKIKPKIYACSSRRSISGLSRIIRLLKPEIDVIRINDSSEIARYQAENKNGNGNKDFKLLLHNICCIEPDIIKHSLIFGLQSVAITLLKDKFRDKFIENPPLALWVNSKSAQRRLAEVGIASKVMYRPNEITFSNQYIPPVSTDKKRVLWYWKEGRADFKQHKQIIIDAVRQLPDIEFLFFPVIEAPIKADNVSVLSRINIAEYCKSVLGMVRVSSEFDLGRSIYEVAANGRWTLTYKLDEPFTIPITNDLNSNHLAERIQYCCDNFGDDYGLQLWNYTRDNFNETVLRKQWIDGIKQVFNL